MSEERKEAKKQSGVDVHQIHLSTTFQSFSIARSHRSGVINSPEPVIKTASASLTLSLVGYT